MHSCTIIIACYYYLPVEKHTYYVTNRLAIPNQRNQDKDHRLMPSDLSTVNHIVKLNCTVIQYI